MMTQRAAVSDIPVRQSGLHGPEVWAERAGLIWSWWDVWFCAVAVADHGSDLADLDGCLASAPNPPLAGRGPKEAKLSHLDDLRKRLAGAGLLPQDLATADLMRQRGVLARARKRVWLSLIHI